MTATARSIETASTQLAAKIVSYCKDRSLALDGMALDLENGAPLDADMCDAISAYCAAKHLELGGLLAEVEALFSILEEQDRVGMFGGSTQLCSFRNLYRVKAESGRVVAFVTAHDHTAAEERYSLAGGAEQSITIEQISNGYPSDECRIYA